MLCRKFELIHLNFLSYHLHLHVCILITLSLLPETSTDPQNELHLLPEPLFCLPSDNISMTAVLGTCTGRMFLAGKDGCLYENCVSSKCNYFDLYGTTFSEFIKESFKNPN